MAMKQFEIARALSPDEILVKGDVFSRLWHSVFMRSFELGTSDIHVEPFAGRLRVRVRQSGELVLLQEVTEGDLLDQLMVRLKEIAGLDISTRDDVQDAAFELKSTASRYRAALAPGAYGETVVLRVIRDSALPNLSEVNLSPAAERDLRFALGQEKGFICITGPTGSGKSSTLQACLMEVDRDKQKVISLEDPIERKIPGVVQQQISGKLTWAKGIKAAMRQDPDIILVGEIRDPESAALAFQAAQTGHLVLSTLHTNDAAGVVDRLIGLGVDRHVIAENLLFISAQRLLPKLCPDCRAPDGTAWTRGAGCKACGGMGIKGRIPILEYGLQPREGSVLTFARERFRASELKQTLWGETKKLAEAGVVDCRLIEQYAPEA
jgi:type II secretory ATPase GspE/PulE/Tfp pilus assembly ATPase PilB-like protein